jgi:hypothetical protein
MTGSTPEEAIRELLVEAPEWFELNIKSGYEILPPAHHSKYSGRIKVLTKSSPGAHQSGELLY